MDSTAYRCLLDSSIQLPPANARFIRRVHADSRLKLLFLGGSITQGYVPGGGVDTPYPRRVADWCRTRLPGGPELEQVNLGLAGYHSDMGLATAAKELDLLNPNLVFVEFAVNNGFDKASADSFESLIRRLLKHSPELSVVVICACLESGYTCEPYMADIALRYDLPVIGLKSALELGKSQGRRWEEYACDNAHPSEAGHRLIADCLIRLFETVLDAETATFRQSPVHPPGIPEDCLFGRSLENPVYYDHRNLRTQTLGSFVPSATHARFPYGWVSRPDGDGPLMFKMRCSRLLVLYELGDPGDAYGRLSVKVNGREMALIAGTGVFGWQNPVCARVWDSPAEQEIEVSLTVVKDSEEAGFVLLGLLAG
ncbi:SGNH/GDSL hydrolase family protein [Gorillibacterium sp. sgz500922]|uniref:SGNH/GDSL hydrolase family protein n=1 Tax=Gorillibacterium sp. sgz500922 TaxID=3446694 RepID=UPI003F67688F